MKKPNIEFRRHNTVARMIPYWGVMQNMETDEPIITGCGKSVEPRRIDWLDDTAPREGTPLTPVQAAVRYRAELYRIQKAAREDEDFKLLIRKRLVMKAPRNNGTVREQKQKPEWSGYSI